jgi:dihydrofolate synthase/folylpolyglutamate synthase
MQNDIHLESKLSKTLKRMFTLHPKLIDFNLSRLKRLMQEFNEPENKLNNVIHIAGTNGKGSTASFLKQILEAHNLSVNIYTSPHLINFKERIRIKGEIISNELLIDILKEIEIKNNKKPLTFFEITTAAALISFFRYPTDINIIETGLGGRLDATNIIDNKTLCLITKIGYDHTEFLGKTIESIAYEKAGILRKNVPVIIAKQDNLKAYETLQDSVLKIDTTIIDRITLSNDIPLGLKGSHQYENASTAYTAAAIVIPKISKLKAYQGLSNTLWHGRIEEIKSGKIIKYRNNITILDGAHNIDGAIIIRKFLEKQTSPKWNLIIGMLNNRDIKPFVREFKNYINITFTIPIKNQVSSSHPNKLALELKELGLKSYSTFSLEQALKEANKDIPLLITGSLYLAGEVLEFNNTVIK